jgi:hypothetical protein
MSIRVRLLLGCALSVLLPACVESEHPLSDPLKSQQDSRQYGVWRKTNEDGTVEYLHVGREVSEPLDPVNGAPIVQRLACRRDAKTLGQETVPRGRNGSGRSC